MIALAIGAALALGLGDVLARRHRPWSASPARRPARAAVPVLAGLLIAVPAPARAQEPERPAVVGAVQELFDAMAARDTTRAAAVLMPDAFFFAARQGAEPTATSAPAFLERLARAEVPWIERLWSPTVKVHGDVAIVWAPYDFMRGDAFSHCGVDAFTLVRSGGRWRISGATYTVEPDPAACDADRPR